MRFWVYFIGFVVSILAVSSQSCPSDHFSAIFVLTADQTIEEPIIVVDDPELTFLTDVLKFREQDLRHFIEDAFYFFNVTFGLDFSTPSPDSRHERHFENATITPFYLSDDLNFYITSNNWIRTGSTRSSCYKFREGGAQITFSGEQTLHGSYGGVEGKPAYIRNSLAYGFYVIDACEQSPVIIQFQSSTPIRSEPVDGITVFNFDLYSKVLGYGKTQGIGSLSPDPYQPEKYRFVLRNTITFPS